MADAIGIRLDKVLLKKIKKLEELESLDRSTVLRKLIVTGYKETMKEKSAESYREGKITLSEAARRAETTLWEMEQFLVEKGFTSKYSVSDLQEELNSLVKINHKT